MGLIKTPTKKLAVLFAAVPVIFFGLFNGIYLGRLSPNLSLAIDIIFMVVIPCISFYILSNRFSFSLKDIGLLFNINVRQLIEDAIVCTVIFLVADWLLSNLSWALLRRFDWANTQVFLYSQILPAHPVLRAFVFIYLVVSAAIIEEIFYRGVIRYLWIEWFGKGKWGYIIVSATLFGLGHWEGGLSKTVTTFFLGLIAARLFIWTKSLWPLIIAHLFTDIVFL